MQRRECLRRKLYGRYTGIQRREFVDDRGDEGANFDANLLIRAMKVHA